MPQLIVSGHMPSQTMTLTVPEYVFDQLAAQAQMAGQPVGVIASQMLARAVSPPVEESLPPALRAELEAMTLLSDVSVLQIARSRMNEDKVALYDVLLDRNQDGTLTMEGRELLRGLREEADALMLRKAHAYALLKSRGHRLAVKDLGSRRLIVMTGQ
ncbi:MAG: hypothetical protein H6646_06700 [Anaerolineales bacterium]|nr:hypothetical protein [Anaerolineales bacterium]